MDTPQNPAPTAETAAPQFSVPVPPVPGEATRAPEAAEEAVVAAAPSRLKERAASAALGTARYTGMYVATPFVVAVSASAGALVTFIGARKLGWL